MQKLEDNQSNPKHAAILWTGGKDSALALHEARLTGYDVVALVTFAPVGSEFRAHPVPVMTLQAKALGIPHSILELDEPLKKAYEIAIAGLKQAKGIEVLVTGDIAEVDGQQNWIRECSEPSRMEVFTPLWGMDRTLLLNRLIADGFRAIFSLVKKPWFTEDWVGKALDNRSIEDLTKISADTGLDVCGENGEYHTLVLDGPEFTHPIRLESCAVRRDYDLMCIDMERSAFRFTSPGAETRAGSPDSREKRPG